MQDPKEPPELIPYRPVRLSELLATERISASDLPFLIAVKFNYDVKQGGFSQLLYNLQGNLLPEVEGMLLTAKAVVAHEYYVRAVRLCLEDMEEYFRFLSSDYTQANNLKHLLQALSIEYLNRKVDFVDEAKGFVAIPRG
jgi:hypothetical protein